MPRKAGTMALCLTEETRSALSALARSRTAPAHHVERSAIILHLADRRDTNEIATTLRIDRQRITRCARRVTAVGPLKAIDDLPRSGRPPEITGAARAWLIGEACVKAKERGYPHELWTLRLLAMHARSYGPGAGHACLTELAPSTVHEILNSQPVKPHKVRYYLERRDPAFEERKGEVLELYAAAEMLREIPEADRPVAVLSYDEKPGIQAIATTAPDLPPRPGKHATAHRSRETRRFLTGKPGRFELVFTPTHASWLNYVETFFSKVARSVLRRIRVGSKVELGDRIRRYIEVCNASPVVPNWRYGLSRDEQPLAA